MASKRKFYRTVITVELLSEDPVSFEDLASVHTSMTDGDCSGIWNVTKTEEIDGPTAAKLLQEQGSDPEFFQIDEAGNDVGYEGVESCD